MSSLLNHACSWSPFPPAYRGRTSPLGSSTPYSRSRCRSTMASTGSKRALCVVMPQQGHSSQ
eukprot:2949208-Prymnesium_polylepis.1